VADFHQNGQNLEFQALEAGLNFKKLHGERFLLNY